ncbi:MAG: dTMP kinase [Candidatus Bathyarchaeota archaeon]|nr:MAG: dTMP kinase [Candidatus Bathyarchaeota archaeon]
MTGRTDGVFICIEGLDGSGKTTQARLLIHALRERGYDPAYTTEPSDGIYGEIIRKRVLQGDLRIPAVIETVLFAVDRFDHIQSTIRPLLDKGKIVVCDRYVYSSIAYQGAAKLDIQWIEKINRHAIEPHLVIYIDLPPEIVIKRIRRQKSVMETLRTQEKVREVYLNLVGSSRVKIIDGNNSIECVAKAVNDLVLPLVEGH